MAKNKNSKSVDKGKIIFTDLAGAQSQTQARKENSETVWASTIKGQVLFHLGFTSFWLREVISPKRAHSAAAFFLQDYQKNHKNCFKITKTACNV